MHAKLTEAQGVLAAGSKILDTDTERSNSAAVSAELQRARGSRSQGCARASVDSEEWRAHRVLMQVHQCSREGSSVGTPQAACLETAVSQLKTSMSAKIRNELVN